MRTSLAIDRALRSLAFILLSVQSVSLMASTGGLSPSSKGLSAGTISKGHESLGSDISSHVDSTSRSLQDLDFLVAVDLIQTSSNSVNMGLAFERFLRAAQSGHKESMFNVAVMYERGLGTRQNTAEALSWYQRAADLGVGDAYFNMGRMYEKGRLVKKDAKKAASLYTKAAELDSVEAISNLGVLYATGEGVEKDKGRAVMLFCHAAAKGDLYGLENLGLALTNGFGVEKDLTLGSAIAVFADQKYREAASEQGSRQSFILDQRENNQALFVDVSSFFRESVASKSQFEAGGFCPKY